MKKAIFILTFFGLLAVAFCGYQLRFQMFPDWSPPVSGRLVAGEEPAWGQKIDQYFEKYHADKNSRAYQCAHNFLGRDDKFIYVDLVCGKFTKNEKGEVVTEYGYQAPTRVEYNASEIVGFNQPVDGDDYPASYSWLFPKEVQANDRLFGGKGDWKGIHLKIFERAMK